jgi:hypothetical protein
VSERDFMDWAVASGAINHREALGGLYWAQVAWKHQQARVAELEGRVAMLREALQTVMDILAGRPPATTRKAEEILDHAKAAGDLARAALTATESTELKG